MDLYKAQTLAKELMTQHGLITNLPWTNWKFHFDNAKRIVGRCYTTRRCITLSKPITLLNDEAHIRNTILHEIAHALVGPGHGHDNVWKLMAIKVGAVPETYCSMDVVLPKPRYEAKCAICGRVHSRYKRPRANALIICKCQAKSPIKHILVYKNTFGNTGK
jgi:predicted SprT family Zn-dependent metalloprotease